jgi:hypothetical protein
MRTGPFAAMSQPGIFFQTEGRDNGMNSVLAIDAMLP